MTPLKPIHQRWNVARKAATADRRTLAALDHVAIVTPHRVPVALWQQVPGLDAIRRRLGRLGKAADDRVFRHYLGDGAGVTFGRLPATTGALLPPAFQLLKFAGELIADALADEPRTLGILPIGFAPADEAALTRALLLALGARTWEPPHWRKEDKPARLRTVRLLTAPRASRGARRPPQRTPAPPDLARTLIEIENANLVRWLTALPPNKLTVAAYRELLATLAKAHGWSYRFLDEHALAKAGAGAFLAVSQGNAGRDAGIAHLRYRPAGTPTGRAAAPPAVALVGKGILFDTGGTNLKDAKNMLDMHVDMSGSAVALAVLQALTQLEAPVAVDCWLAITENRTGPTAYKPRDVVTASNGTSIEVMHSDAEGRMVLADALALAGLEQPRLLLDYATLTGTCVYAVSERYSGVFSNRQELEGLLVETGRQSGERVWPFPMDDDFDDDLKSKAADVLQCATHSEGDHILAARFLRRFVPDDSAWVHMDLAAVSRKEGLAHVPGGPTGFGLRYTLALLLDHGDELQRILGNIGLPPAVGAR